MPASTLAGAGMRRHVQSGNHAAESFVSFIPLFDRIVAPSGATSYAASLPCTQEPHEGCPEGKRRASRECRKLARDTPT